MNQKTISKNVLEDRLNTITERIATQFPKKIDLSLGRIESFLNKLGNPHLHIPPVIHVAGTNGKGSTIAFLKSCLEYQEYHCHVATSPHLVRFNERVVLAGQEISTDDYMKLLDECEHVNAGDLISYFEIVIASTFLAFSRVHADFSLIETGLGGRLDATNVIPNPIATIITAISFDHTDYLGDTLIKIASEKAGIMKENVPCIIGSQPQEALKAGVMDVFERRAKDLNVSLLRYGHEWCTQKTESGFILTLHGQEYLFPTPSLIGDHQINNAGAALVTLLSHDRIRTDIEKLRTALKNTSWQARLQKLNDVWAGHNDVWLDGGHNDSAGLALATQMEHWIKQDSKPLHIIIGMVNRKDPKLFLTPILPYVEKITVIDIPHIESSFKAQELIDIIKPIVTCPIHTAAFPQEALQTQSKTARILITGSLYLAGAILADIEKTVPQKNEW